MKRLLRFLKLWDGIWSIPIAVFAFVVIGLLVVSFFGPEAGFIFPDQVQRIAYAAMCMVFGNFIVWFGIYMNFRGVFHYYNKGSGADFQNLPAKTKIWITLAIYVFYFIEFTIFIIFI